MCGMSCVVRSWVPAHRIPLCITSSGSPISVWHNIVASILHYNVVAYFRKVIFFVNQQTTIENN